MLSAPDFKNKQIIIAQLSRGERFSFKNDNIVLKNSAGEIRHQSTCHRLFSLFIVGHVTITSGLLHRAKKFGFSVHLLSHNLRPVGHWQSGAEGNVLLRNKQYQYNSLDIAQHLVGNKIEQQIHTLQKIRKKSDTVKLGIEKLDDYRERLPLSAPNLKTILGTEGIASRVYFSSLFENNEWKGRKPRVKHDINNLLLDIGYTLLFRLMDSLLNLYGFDNYKGVYHQTFYQRKSLVCDLIEPFRPIIDRQLVKSWALNQIKKEDFQHRQNQYQLLGKASEHYTTLLMKSLLTHKEDMFDYVQKYYRAFMKEKPIEKYPTYTCY